MALPRSLYACGVRSAWSEIRSGWRSTPGLARLLAIATALELVGAPGLAQENQDEVGDRPPILLTLPANEFDDLTEGARLADFAVESVYENENLTRVGARFRHAPSGFVLDILRIQSLPQAFVWVNTPPPSDKGEPHTLEHLLLGKGTKGRYVASLEDMSLGESSAYTEQWRTCYHFHTGAGADVFFHLFEEKMDAMLHPTYSDEEIRREVCNIGITESQEDGALGLEEKGTVYNEMVSTYERPGGRLWDELPRLLYGPTHPLAVSSGGEPAAIRELTPGEIRAFHERTHHLNNMGAVFSIGDEQSLGESINRLSAILARLEPGATPGEDPADLVDRLPPSAPAPPGTISRVSFPNQNPNEPGMLVMAWPAERQLNVTETLLLDLFFQAIAGGETSNLYERFIDSQTRLLDLGANGVFAWLNRDPGNPVFVGISNLDPKMASAEVIERVRGLVLEEIRSIAQMAVGSPELEEFNARVRDLLLESQRESRTLLNSPPRFGYRGTGSSWIRQLQLLRHQGFRRNLALVEEVAAVEGALQGGRNPWTALIDDWRLLSEPYVVVTTPDPEMLARDELARKERTARFASGLRDRYEVATEAEAIARYRDEYDARTEEIDAVARTIKMPSFLDDPPLTLDEPLQYHVTKLPGGGDLVVSTFDNMTSATVGLAFSLYGVPEEMLVYLPSLGTILRSIGVHENGKSTPYDKFEEVLRREVESVSVRMSSDRASKRVELLVTGSGTTLAETERALHWMETVLFHSDLRPENLPRLRDAVKLELGNQRNRMRRSEESWVQDASRAYEMQDRPLYLATECFLTAAHSLHRLRWMLMEGDPSTIRDFEELARLLAGRRENRNRAQLTALLDGIAEMVGAGSDAPGDAAGGARSIGAAPIAGTMGERDDGLAELHATLARISPSARTLAHEAVQDLQKTLGELPDDSLAEDVGYLWHQMAADLRVTPAATLEDLQKLLGMIRRQDLTRGYLVGCVPATERLSQLTIELVGRLEAAPTPRHTYSTDPSIDQRLMARSGAPERPNFVGLVNESTRSGVHIHTARCASYRDTDADPLLRFLAARLYGGGGAHSMFMRTWSAGLAYSNGLRSDERSGRLVYYAERCPDLTQTMQFVTEVLETSPEDPALADYAVAQAFSGVRAGARYEERAAAMAADLADQVAPEVVARFRQRILELRNQPGFYGELQRRMIDVYGEVLPGLGPTSALARARSAASYFVIGPESQMQSWESYLQRVEPGARLARLYPRDFWQVCDLRKS